MGRGTEFRVQFPARETVSTKEVEKSSKPVPRGNGELLLLVDDEAAVFEIARISLENNGYRILIARDGTEAISIYAEKRNEIRLVVTDMSMPYMDAPALIRALRKITPGLRIIGASGLADHGRPAEAMAIRLDTFLSKPFTSEQLSRAISEVLGGG